jgi:hypothetical protein
MDTNIDISTIHNYFLMFHEEKIKNINNDRKNIVQHSFFSINEANIANMIKKIPYYSNYFSILEDYEFINLFEINEHIFEKLNNSEKFYLFKYLDVESIDLIDYIYNFTSIKKLISSIIDSFLSIFTGLSILNENNICFFDISPNKIIFLKDHKDKPVLSDFKLSLRVSKLDIDYLSNILNKLDDFTYLPIEIHVIFYFIKNEMSTISYTFIEEFCELFVENLNILKLFSANYKKIYKDKCIETLKKYINQSKQYIINDILERHNKWDIYGISMLYIQIFGSISRIFSLKGTFISKIVLELTKNLHPDSDKRMTLEETFHSFNILLHQQQDWSFINQLNNDKLDVFFTDLSQ